MQNSASLIVVILLALRCTTVLASPVARGEAQGEAPKGQTPADALVDYLKDDTESDLRRIDIGPIHTTREKQAATILSEYATAVASDAAERAGYASDVTLWSWMATEHYAVHKTSSTTSTSQATSATQEVDSTTPTASSTEAASTTAATPAPTAAVPASLETDSPVSSIDSLASASSSLSSSAASPSDGTDSDPERSTAVGSPEDAERNAEPQYRTQARRRRRGNRLDKQ